MNGGVYEARGEIYRALALRAHEGPAFADYIVRRDSDERFGGHIVDLAADEGPDAARLRNDPEAYRFEVYDDAGRFLAPAQSLRGAVSMFARRGVRWVPDRRTTRTISRTGRGWP